MGADRGKAAEEEIVAHGRMAGALRNTALPYGVASIAACAVFGGLLLAIFFDAFHGLRLESVHLAWAAAILGGAALASITGKRWFALAVRKLSPAARIRGPTEIWIAAASVDSGALCNLVGVLDRRTTEAPDVPSDLELALGTARRRFVQIKRGSFGVLAAALISVYVLGFPGSMVTAMVWGIATGVWVFVIDLAFRAGQVDIALSYARTLAPHYPSSVVG